MSSCTSDFEDVANLQVNLATVSFDTSGGTTTVEVSSNKEWSYMTNLADDSWLTLEQSAGMLKVTASPNTSGQERHATIMVSSGTENKKIDVAQQAVDLEITLSNNEIAFGYKAAGRMVAVSGSNQTWTIEAVNESWLKVHGKNGGELIYIEVTDNETYEAREATVVLKAPNGEQRGVKVHQDGITKFFLPMEIINKPYSSAALLTFEQDRDNILISHTEPAVVQNQAVNGNTYYFTPSKYMPQIIYERYYGDISYTYAYMLLKLQEPTAATHPEYDEYVEFLKAAGYTISNPTDVANTESFVREDHHMVVTLQTRSTDVVAIFEPLYFQETAMPTFSAVPSGPTGFLDLMEKLDVRVDQVKAFESKLGSTLYIEEKEDYGDRIKNLQYTTGNTGTQEAQRGYYFYTPRASYGEYPDYNQTVGSVSLYYDNPDLGTWQKGVRLYLTNEFKALMDKSDYRYLGYSNGEFQFAKTYNNDSILVLYVERAKYTNVLDGRTSLALSFVLNDKPAGWDAAAAAAKMPAAIYGVMENRPKTRASYMRRHANPFAIKPLKQPKFKKQ